VWQGVSGGSVSGRFPVLPRSVPDSSIAATGPGLQLVARLSAA
jgi:hypothetical protein